MTMYPAIKMLQPEPFDLVDRRVQVAGVGTGFEATIGLRVRDGESRQIPNRIFPGRPLRVPMGNRI